MTQLATQLVKDASDKVIETLRDNHDKVCFPNFGSGNNILKKGFTLDRVMFKIPGTDFEIYWYGFLIALGILIGMIYGFKRMRSFGIDPDRATDSVIGGLIGAIVGARLYYIIFSDEMKMSEFFNFRQGGLAIYGGIIGALLIGGIIAKLRKLKLTALLDVAAPCFLIGQAIGRWGNFFNQEAFGSNTSLPWGMMSWNTMSFLAENDNIGGTASVYAPVHPCFLYESLWCIIGFVILHIYSKHRKFDGEVFLMYIGWYGLGRFFIEAMRTDSLYLGNIKISQLLAALCVIATIILIIIFRGVFKRRGDYQFFYETELSKQQLEKANKNAEMQKEKKELKKKIKEAKANGESFAEFENEYNEKFGKNKISDTADKAVETIIDNIDDNTEEEKTDE
ncbi:MAG: prolipoprotein diacylglyceryl transferase [Ruminococcus sp.]|nr:prolipoprotein diacylglyceryl transferase [Ruminococcus sp.]